MNRIKVNHYTDLLMYKIEQVIKSLKYDLNQYINNLNIGLTAEQLFVLDTISSENNACQQDIAEKLSKDKSNIKRIVEILENKGFITRKTGKKNNRLVNYLYITKSGKKVIDDNINKIKEYMEQLFSPISTEEEQILRDLVERLKKDISSD